MARKNTASVQQNTVWACKELKQYQKRIGMTNSGICIYCDMDEEESVEHVLCRCPQLEAARKEAWPEEFDSKMLVMNPEVCRKVLGRRYPALRRTAIRDESRDGPLDCVAQQA